MDVGMQGVAEGWVSSHLAAGFVIGQLCRLEEPRIWWGGISCKGPGTRPGQGRGLAKEIHIETTKPNQLETACVLLCRVNHEWTLHYFASIPGGGNCTQSTTLPRTS